MFRLTKIKFIGCKSHILALAVKNEFIRNRNYSELVEKVNKLCAKLRNCSKRGHLRNVNQELTPFVNNGIRWSAIFVMIRRHRMLRPFIDRRDRDLEKLLLTAHEEDEVDDLFHLLCSLENATKYLQDRDINLSDARICFDGLLIQFPDLHHLKEEHQLIYDRPFESGVIKIIRSEEDQLTNEEIDAVKIFIKIPNDTIEIITTPPVLAGNDNNSVSIYDARAYVDMENSKKKRKLMDTSQYYLLQSLPCTTCITERLFSKCRHILTYDRQAMSPKTLEALVYLKCNREWWNITAIQECMLSDGEEDELVASNLIDIFDDDFIEVDI